MPIPEGYSPRPDEIRAAEASMDERQRELTETREDAKYEERIQGAEKQNDSSEAISPEERIDNDVYSVVEGHRDKRGRLLLEYIQQGLEDHYKHYETDEISQSLSRLERQGKIIHEARHGHIPSHWRVANEAEGK